MPPAPPHQRPSAPPHPPGSRTAPDTQARQQGSEQPRARQGDKWTAPPPELNMWSTRPGQETRRGTNCLKRPNRRPAPEPRVVRAPQRPQGGQGLHRGSTSAHTPQQTGGAEPKGHRTQPRQRTDCMKLRTGRRREGTPGRDNPQRAPRGTRSAGDEGDTRGEARGGTGRNPPDLPRAPRTHHQGSAPAKAVVPHSATHQPHG